MLQERRNRGEHSLGAAPSPVHDLSGGVTTRDRCRRDRRSHGNGPPPPEPSGEEGPTLLEAGYRWLASYVATTRNPKGQRLARTRFDTYVLGWLSHRTLRQLNGDDIREFRLALEQHWELSAYTVTHVLSDLRCFLRWAVSAASVPSSSLPISRE